MIDNFNGIIFLALYVLVLIGNIYYAYCTLINAKNWLDKYAVDHSALVITRVLGSIISGFALIGIYILFTGVEGTWPYFASLFTGFLIMAISGIYTTEFDWPKNYEGKEGFKEVKINKENYIPAIIFALLLGIIMYGLSDKIYS